MSGYHNSDSEQDNSAVRPSFLLYGLSGALLVAATASLFSILGNLSGLWYNALLYSFWQSFNVLSLYLPALLFVSSQALLRPQWLHALGLLSFGILPLVTLNGIFQILLATPSLLNLWLAQRAAATTSLWLLSGLFALQVLFLLLPAFRNFLFSLSKMVLQSFKDSEHYPREELEQIGRGTSVPSSSHILPPSVPAVFTEHEGKVRPESFDPAFYPRGFQASSKSVSSPAGLGAGSRAAGAKSWQAMAASLEMEPPLDETLEPELSRNIDEPSFNLPEFRSFAEEEEYGEEPEGYGESTEAESFDFTALKEDLAKGELAERKPEPEIDENPFEFPIEPITEDALAEEAAEQGAGHRDPGFDVLSTNADSEQLENDLLEDVARQLNPVQQAFDQASLERPPFFVDRNILKQNMEKPDLEFEEADRHQALSTREFDSEHFAVQKDELRQEKILLRIQDADEVLVDEDMADELLQREQALGDWRIPFSESIALPESSVYNRTELAPDIEEFDSSTAELDSDRNGQTGNWNKEEEEETTHENFEFAEEEPEDCGEPTAAESFDSAALKKDLVKGGLSEREPEPEEKPLLLAAEIDENPFEFPIESIPEGVLAEGSAGQGAGHRDPRFDVLNTNADPEQLENDLLEDVAGQLNPVEQAFDQAGLERPPFFVDGNTLKQNTKKPDLEFEEAERHQALNAREFDSEHFAAQKDELRQEKILLRIQDAAGFSLDEAMADELLQREQALGDWRTPFSESIALPESSAHEFEGGIEEELTKQDNGDSLAWQESPLQHLSAERPASIGNSFVEGMEASGTIQGISLVPEHEVNAPGTRNFSARRQPSDVQLDQAIYLSDWLSEDPIESDSEEAKEENIDVAVEPEILSAGDFTGSSEAEPNFADVPTAEVTWGEFARLGKEFSEGDWENKPRESAEAEWDAEIGQMSISDEEADSSYESKLAGELQELEAEPEHSLENEATVPAEEANNEKPFQEFLSNLTDFKNTEAPVVEDALCAEGGKEDIAEPSMSRDLSLDTADELKDRTEDVRFDEAGKRRGEQAGPEIETETADSGEDFDLDLPFSTSSTTREILDEIEDEEEHADFVDDEHLSVPEPAAENSEAEGEPWQVEFGKKANSPMENFTMAEAAEQALQEKEERDALREEKLAQKMLIPPVAGSWNSNDISLKKLIGYDLEQEFRNAQIDPETEEAGEALLQTLKKFKIEAEMTHILKGPSITEFGILPAPGIKLNRVEQLADNLAMELAARSIRIVAPIPGKKAVGVEIPNRRRSTVSFPALMDSEEMQKARSEMQLPIVLGKEINGSVQIADLRRMPHLLIAGATGSGKSVCVNVIISSLILGKTPQQLRLLMIDPKIVELKQYNEIPHLLSPVITDAKLGLQALQWVSSEMERRYALLDAIGAGNKGIESYNRYIKEKNMATLPLEYIVVIIDEFADLMGLVGKELEGMIARLAAMSRAVGIHLVLATQRPSVDVVTGLIKANFPTRIAFMVASQTDSRTILDQKGAEQLLGQGDMLFSFPGNPLVRVQGAYLSEEEAERISTYTKSLGAPAYLDEIIFADDEEEETHSLELSSDGLFPQAVEIAHQAGEISTSFIQRKLSIGYNRAARIIDEMEECGFIGPAQGSKKREVLHRQ